MRYTFVITTGYVCNVAGHWVKYYRKLQGYNSINGGGALAGLFIEILN